MVVTAWPVTSAAGVTHARVGAPSTSTVHAPHAPTAHPYFAPVSPSSSRSTTSRLRSGAVGTPRVTPLMVNSMDSGIRSLPPRGQLTEGPGTRRVSLQREVLLGGVRHPV